MYSQCSIYAPTFLGLLERMPRRVAPAGGCFEITPIPVIRPGIRNSPTAIGRCYSAALILRGSTFTFASLKAYLGS